MDNTTNCPRCNAPLGQLGYQQPPQQYEPYQQPPQVDQGYQQPPQQYQGQPPQYGPPQGGYQQPPGYNQPPLPPKRAPTVKKVDLAEILMVVSGLFLLQGGIWNLSWIPWGISAAELVLGLAGFIIGMMVIGAVVMPSLFKQLGQTMDMLVLVFGIVFALWGLVAAFGDDLGGAGDSIFVGGFGLLMAGLLRMGVLK